MMTDVQLSHSYSALKLFENCPKRYYHQRIAREVKDVPGEASLHGERVHKSLEKKLLGEQELPTELQEITPVCEKLSASKGELAPEKKLALDTNLTPSEWFAQETWIRAQLDVLIIDAGKAVILDWKTGKRRPDPFQLELSAMMVFTHHPGVNEISAGFFWIPDKKLDPYKYRREQYDRLLNTTLGKINRVEEALTINVWPAKPSGLCNYCPCKAFCSYAKR